MTERKLKPCPFCGSGEVAITETIGCDYVECANCGARGPEMLDGPEEAIAAWNERAEGLAAEALAILIRMIDAEEYPQNFHPDEIFEIYIPKLRNRQTKGDCFICKLKADPLRLAPSLETHEHPNYVPDFEDFNG